MDSTPSKCRCGHSGDGAHPCHFANYQCREPATRRFYNAQPAPLAGMQEKYIVTETWACDRCWSQYTAMLAGFEVLRTEKCKSP